MEAPKRLSSGQLAKVGVRIIEEASVWLRCQSCGTTWCPEPTASGKLPHDYWKCPQGCNAT